ncbi:MAG: hypothetical protein JWQ43_394 [Glaciihabitans sp.]|nr:hypothetical protein [Glaciihabitans sp.]
MRPLPRSRRRHVAVLANVGVFGLLAVSLAGAVGAAVAFEAHTNATPVDARNPYYNGYFEAEQAIGLEYTSLAEGRYRLGYSMDVRFGAQDSRTMLICSFVDSNGIIGYLSGEVQRVPADGQQYHLEYERVFPLPEITVGLRCSPNRSGQLSAQFADIRVSVEELAG